jgi:hypothetical protein
MIWLIPAAIFCINYLDQLAGLVSSEAIIDIGKSIG